MSRIYFCFKYILLLFLAGTVAQSCNIINPAEKTPTYIHVDSFSFGPNAAVTPTPALTHQINTVWAFYNGTEIGIFDLPATFPVLATGSGTLTLYPGIAVDGLNNFLSIYPFYRPDTSTLIAQPAKVINYSPKSAFFTGAKCNPISSSIATGFKPDSNATVYMVDSDGVIYIRLKNQNDSSESYTGASYTIAQGVEAYLEFDYKNTNSFYVGVQANLAGTGYVNKVYLSGVSPSATWQKFYLSLKDFVAQYKGTSYNFFIKASLDQNFIDAGTSSEVLLKNVQIIHY